MRFWVLVYSAAVDRDRWAVYFQRVVHHRVAQIVHPFRRVLRVDSDDFSYRHVHETSY